MCPSSYPMHHCFFRVSHRTRRPVHCSSSQSHCSSLHALGGARDAGFDLQSAHPAPPSSRQLYAPRTTHHAPCTMHHAPCNTHHAPCSMRRLTASCTTHGVPCTTHPLARDVLDGMYAPPPALSQIPPIHGTQVDVPYDVTP